MGNYKEAGIIWLLHAVLVLLLCTSSVGTAVESNDRSLVPVGCCDDAPLFSTATIMLHRHKALQRARNLTQASSYLAVSVCPRSSHPLPFPSHRQERTAVALAHMPCVSRLTTSPVDSIGSGRTHSRSARSQCSTHVIPEPVHPSRELSCVTVVYDLVVLTLCAATTVIISRQKRLMRSRNITRVRHSVSYRVLAA